VPQGNEPTQRLDKRIENSIKDEIRIDLLRILNERAATPRELAEVLGADPSDVLGHIAELWADNCIEVVEDGEPPGDASERRYRSMTYFFVDDWEAQELSLTAREELSAKVLQCIITEALAALRSGSLDSRPDMHLTLKPMRLDDRGWRECMALLLRTLKEAETIEEASRERLGIAGEAGTEAVVALMGFERSEGRTG
jgi:DNA-binding MarR family transcriptional regulator